MGKSKTKEPLKKPIGKSKPTKKVVKQQPANTINTIQSNLAWSRYIPQVPFAKQLAFLMIQHREAFYGGAAGGAKSSALLMAGLQYVEYPGYSGLIMRRTLADLKLPGALIDRAHTWLKDTDAVWVPSEHCWKFPTQYPDGSPGEPAKLQFGYIGQGRARDRYQSSEYQFIGIDEATHIPEADYRYMFSRLRKCACPTHKIDGQGNPIYVKGCIKCQVLSAIPIRFRAASNPGGLSHAFLKKRFDIGPHINEIEAKQKGIEVKFVGRNPDKPYLPAKHTDNPYISQNEYAESLSELDPITREQLLKGDWSVSPDSRLKKHWVKYYSYRGPYIALGEDGNGPVHSMDSLLKVFITVDPAGSSREGMGDSTLFNVEASWTVIAVWGLTDDYQLLLLDMERFQREIPDVNIAIYNMYRRWKPRYACIEGNGLGRGIFQAAQRDGLIIKPIFKDSDKVVNATELIILMSNGKVWIPQRHRSLQDIEDELFTWTGDPAQTDDIVDVFADAAKEVAVTGDAAGLTSSGQERVIQECDTPGYLDSSVGTISDCGSTPGSYTGYFGFG